MAKHGGGTHGTYRKLTNHGEVDKEGDEEGDGGLDEEVEVGLGDGRALASVDLAGLDQGGVQVQVVRHYDGACTRKEFEIIAENFGKLTCFSTVDGLG